MAKNFREMQPELLNRFITSMRQFGMSGANVERDFLQRALQFDPQAMLNEFARGAFGEVEELTREQLEDLRGESAGAGRLDTGFFDADRGDVLKAGQRQLARSISQQALNAGSLGLQNQRMLQEFGMENTNRMLELMASGLDRSQAERNARGGGLFGKLLGFGAGLVLPGAGNVVGERLGNFIGSKVGI